MAKLKKLGKWIKTKFNIQIDNRDWNHKNNCCSYEYYKC